MMSVHRPEGEIMIGVATTLYTVVVPGSLAVLLPWLIASHRGAELAARGWYQHLGWPVALAGAAMIVWCAHDFVVRGRGTPAPFAPPSSLVVFGPFKWTRNPMYLGILLMIGGEALLVWSQLLLVYGLGCWVSLELFLRFYEEPSLRRRFGASYDIYHRQVGRWIGRRRM